MMTASSTRLLVVLAVLGPLAIGVHRAGAAPPEPQPVAQPLVAAARRMPLPEGSLLDLHWLVASPGQHLVDDFEAPTWPDSDTWAVVADLNGAVDGEYVWAASECRQPAGQRGLWAVGGGADGAGLSCGDHYPSGAASAALLLLDLTAMRTDRVSRLDLYHDIWADAAPTEGLLVNVLEFDERGVTTGRRNVYSATGQLAAWTRGLTLDLVLLQDRDDTSWRLDARGRLLALEFLFVSLTPPARAGEGIYLDNLVLVSQEPTAIPVSPVPPTPKPDITNACVSRSDCGTLSVRAYADSRCDGRYQAGVDRLISSQPRVEITAGADSFGARLSSSGSQSFRLPTSQGADVTLVMPDGYEMCGNSANPVVLTARSFARWNRVRLEFRLTPKQ